MSSTAGKNRSILSGLIAPEALVTDTPKSASEPVAARPVPPERLTARLSGLSRVTSGDVKEKTLHLVDPARCRMWARHNRRYDLLNEAACADLLESLRSQGEQEFPAIVRRVTDDPDYDYEVICGARRHWAVSFLRTVEHRQIKFLIEARDLDDEAAFRLADVENRARKDICDYERALDYRNAIEAYYGGVSKRMAERMEVGEVWLSRFLELAKLPQKIVDAYGDIHELKERHARALKPLISNAATRPKVMAEAARLAEEQARRCGSGEPPVDGLKVLERLKGAATEPGRAGVSKSRPEVVTNATGARLFTLRRKGAKTAIFELSLDAKATDAEFHAALASTLSELRAKR
jgi:ParB family chromosome partitioning protein